MKVFQSQGLSLYTLSAAYSSIFNPNENSPFYDFYVGLIKNDVSIMTTTVEEVDAKSYQRAKTNSKDWKVEIKQFEKVLVLSATNIKPIVFPAATEDWGEIKSVVIFRDKDIDQFSAYSHFGKPITVKMEDPPTSPGFGVEKISFAMPLLEEEKDEDVISTILKGEKSVMIGKVEVYEGCPLEDPSVCSEHQSELRCGLARKDKICKKVTRLKGTASPDMKVKQG